MPGLPARSLLQQAPGERSRQGAWHCGDVGSQAPAANNYKLGKTLLLEDQSFSQKSGSNPKQSVLPGDKEEWASTQEMSTPASVMGGSRVCPGSGGLIDRCKNATACTWMGQSPAVHSSCPTGHCNNRDGSSEPKQKHLLYLCEGLCALHISRKVTATHQLPENPWFCQTPF